MLHCAVEHREKLVSVNIEIFKCCAAEAVGNGWPIDPVRSQLWVLCGIRAEGRMNACRESPNTCGQGLRLWVVKSLIWPGASGLLANRCRLKLSDLKCGLRLP